MAQPSHVTSYHTDWNAGARGPVNGREGLGADAHTIGPSALQQRTRADAQKGAVVLDSGVGERQCEPLPCPIL
jgi:hypothetical protein